MQGHQHHDHEVGDIIDEWAKLRAPPQKTLDWLLDNGVTPQAIIDAGGIVIAEVTFAKDRTLGPWFEFSDDGEPALILRCEESGLLIDVAAMSLTHPTRFARLERRAWALGPDLALSPSRLGNDPHRLPPVHVYRTPLSWLQGGADGLVILDADKARDELWPFRQIAAEDQHHGQQMKRLMRRATWREQIVVPRRVDA